MKIGHYPELELTASIPRDLLKHSIRILLNLQTVRIRKTVHTKVFADGPDFTTEEIALRLSDDLYYRVDYDSIDILESIQNETKFNHIYHPNYGNSRTIKASSVSDVSITNTLWFIHGSDLDALEQAKRYIESNNTLLTTLLNLQHADGSYVFNEDLRKIANIELERNHRL